MHMQLLQQPNHSWKRVQWGHEPIVTEILLSQKLVSMEAAYVKETGSQVNNAQWSELVDVMCTLYFVHSEDTMKLYRAVSLNTFTQ